MHKIEDMMVLCPTCHHSIDSYSKENQKKYKNLPFNKQKINSTGNLIISQGICAIDTGVIKLLGDGPIIISKQEFYLEFYVNEDNLLEINLRLFNENGKQILSIIRNEWTKGDISCWDIEFISASKVLKIKEKQGKTNLEINAKNLPVLIKGDFWIDRVLLSFNSKGIFLNQKACLTPPNLPSLKFGINHFEEGAYPIIIKDGACFAGVDHFSGCYIDIKDDNALELKPKPIPYIQDDKNLTERILKQAVETFEYFKSNITFYRDMNNPFLNGMDVIKEPISIIPFKRKLARFYVARKQTQKALDIYMDIQKVQHIFFKKPNIEEAETLLEVSKYLFHIGNTKKAKEIFINSHQKFISTNNEPYRVIDFAENLFKKDEQCFCGSKRLYKDCHYMLRILKQFKHKKEIPFNIAGIPKDSRVDLFLLKTHNIDNLCYSEEYLKGYEHVCSKKCSNTFKYDKFATHSEIPMIIRIQNYGLLPIQMEFVLREKGLSFKLIR